MTLRRSEILLTLPSFVWLVAFFALPMGIILMAMFHPTDPAGGIGAGWTAAHLKSLSEWQYAVLLWRTLWLSGLTTVLCVCIALPVAWLVARSAPKWKSMWLLLLILPFWTSFLLRIFAWKVLLHPEGLLASALRAVHLLDERSGLLYGSGAVLLVMVYTHLPFAILPLFAAADKFDWPLLDAARDLGATAAGAIWSVFLPGIRRGIVSAAILVFVSAVGSYVIPELVGGTDAEMLGNRIVERALSQRNLPLASALSALLMAVVLLPLTLTSLPKPRP